MKYFETSAATGHNVSKAIETLLDLVLERMENSIEHQMLHNNNVAKVTLNAHKAISSDTNKKTCAC